MREMLARSRRCLTAESRDAIAAYIASRRCADGGYSGKSSTSDLYYTLFAAASLEALRKWRPLLSLPRYLERFGVGEGLDFIHTACLARLWAGFPLRRDLGSIFERIEAYRAKDGGYHHAIRGAANGSAYALFIALETYAAARREFPESSQAIVSLESLRTSDGGYANEPEQEFGQTNASAAALLARMRLGLPAEDECIRFLLARHEPVTGGFFAFPRAYRPDLLSTASALFALRAAGAALSGIAPGVRGYVEALWAENGGFSGMLDDGTPDCEYTFYALLALGAAMPG